MKRRRRLDGIFARFFRGTPAPPRPRVRPNTTDLARAAVAASIGRHPSRWDAGRWDAGRWRARSATLAAALIVSAAAFPAALPAAAQEPSGFPPPETVGVAQPRTPFLTTEAMIGAGRSPLSEDLLAADSGGLLGAMRSFLDSILEGDLLPAITLKDATVAGVGGDELGYAYGEEAADLEGGAGRGSEAGPGVELADVPDPGPAEAPGDGSSDGSSDGSGDGSGDSSDFTSPSLGGQPGSLDDVAGVDPSGFGTEDRDTPPDGGDELASLGLPGESPASDLTPQEEASGGEQTALPSVPEAQPAPTSDDQTDGRTPPPPVTTPSAPAADPPLAEVADPASTEAAPEEDGSSSDDAAGTVPADVPRGAADPYAPSEPAPDPYPSSREPTHPGTETDAGLAEDGYDPGTTDGATGAVVGAIVSDPADDSGEYPGTYPDDPNSEPTEGSVSPTGEEPLPEGPRDQTAGEGTDAESPNGEEAAGKEATVGEITEGQEYPGPAMDPESGTEDGLTDAPESPGDEPRPTDGGIKDGAAEDGGAGLASPDPAATEDGVMDGSQSPQPDDPTDQAQPTEETTQADQTDGQTDPTDPAVDDADAQTEAQTDTPATGPSEGGPRQGSSGGADPVHTPDAEGRRDVPEDPTPLDWDEREVATGFTGDLSSAGYPDGSGQATARKKAPDAPQPVVAKRDATQTPHVSTRDAHASSSGRAAKREDRQAERRAARVAEGRADRMAARQAQRRAAAVADRRSDRRAERVAERVAEARARRQAPSLSDRVPSARRAAGIARGRAAPANHASYGVRLIPATSTTPRAANTGRPPVPRPRLATPNRAAPAPTPASRPVTGQVYQPAARPSAGPDTSGGPAAPRADGIPGPAFSAPAGRQTVPGPPGKAIGG